MVCVGAYNTDQIGRYSGYYKSASFSSFNDGYMDFKGLFQVNTKNVVFSVSIKIGDI